MHSSCSTIISIISSSAVLFSTGTLSSTTEVVSLVTSFEVVSSVISF
ncbi:MAG: hypothetical protein MR271_08125 [Fusobacterium sp.]|nr:hypothetical protein [Fusobacterium sp.]